MSKETHLSPTSLRNKCPAGVKAGLPIRHGRGWRLGARRGELVGRGAGAGGHVVPAHRGPVAAGAHVASLVALVSHVASVVGRGHVIGSCGHGVVAWLVPSRGLVELQEQANYHADVSLVTSSPTS